MGDEILTQIIFLLYRDLKMNNELKMFLEEMKNRMPIDRFNLPVECADQACLNDLVGDKVVSAKDEMNGTKDALRLIEAKLMDEIRRDKDAFSLDKLTEVVVNACIIRQPRYITALSELRQAEKIHGRLQVIQESVAQRKTQLSNLTEQFVHDFYNNVDKQVGERNVRQVQDTENSASEEQIMQRRKDLAIQRKQERNNEGE